MEMVAPDTKHNPKFQLFPARSFRKDREAASRKLLLMKEFGTIFGNRTVPKLEVMLATRQNFNEEKPAMFDPPSHTYAQDNHKLSSGFAQRLLFQQKVKQRRIDAQERKKKNSSSTMALYFSTWSKL
jgi:hypothetical protein